MFSFQKIKLIKHLYVSKSKKFDDAFGKELADKMKACLKGHASQKTAPASVQQ
ncbi:MAG: hypothetical protein PHV20_05135 [Bacteroidales bacterium]|nr:hypothetical protein [Bacteroidales bacterium]